MIEAGGYWKGAESPAALRIVHEAPLKNLPDCPACKFGTLAEVSGAKVCIDCVERWAKKNAAANHQQARRAA